MVSGQGARISNETSRAAAVAGSCGRGHGSSWQFVEKANGAKNNARYAGYGQSKI
jgi:hypothetical protein